MKPSRQRKLIKIDESSYLNTFCDEETTDVIIFIHGIFGHHEGTWKEMPPQLLLSMSHMRIDFGSFGYKSTILDLRKLEEDTEQFILWMRTHINHYKRIFVVAHSMGGIIMRQVCVRLVNSNNSFDWKLYNTIKHCFFVAVPLSGSWVAQHLERISILRRINRKISMLSRPSIDGDDLATAYNDALKIAKDKQLERPKFSIFCGTRDNIVSKPGNNVLCEDDIYEGPVPGSHGKVKNDQTSNSTLSNRIAQLIDARISDGELDKFQFTEEETISNDFRNRKTNASDNLKDIILIPCSNTKNNDNNTLHPENTTIVNFIDSHELSEKIINKRAEITTLIQSGRFVGKQFQEGNRAVRNQNKRLIFGPDMGGVINEQRFLPAYIRYNGRCFQTSPSDWQKFYTIDEYHRPDIIIVSGLYGLVPANEYIQDYDCHVTDVDTETNKQLVEYWVDLFLPLLKSRFTAIEQAGYSVGRIFDLLIEPCYAGSINWSDLSTVYTTLHMKFERFNGRNALENVGVWLENILRDPNLLKNISYEKFYEEPRFVNRDRYMFTETLS